MYYRASYGLTPVYLVAAGMALAIVVLWLLLESSNACFLLCHLLRLRPVVIIKAALASVLESAWVASPCTLTSWDAQRCHHRL